MALVLYIIPTYNAYNAFFSSSFPRSELDPRFHGPWIVGSAVRGSNPNPGIWFPPDYPPPHTICRILGKSQQQTFFSTAAEKVGVILCSGLPSRNRRGAPAPRGNGSHGACLLCLWETEGMDRRVGSGGAIESWFVSGA